MRLLLAGAVLLLAWIPAQAQSKGCRKHPQWTQEQCSKVENKTLFVGMTREMVDAEKPRSCMLDKHPHDTGTVQFVCYAQWDRSEPAHLYPYFLHFKFVDGLVASFFYN